MKGDILVFGDIHVNKDLVRVSECLNFLEYVRNYCKENDIHNIVNLGDTFHTSNNVRQQSFVPIFKKFLDMKKDGLDIYTINGNHDQMNKDSDSLAETFESFGTFIKKTATINIDGYDYDFMSYTEDPSELPNKSRVLFTHLGVLGFMYAKKKDDTSLFTEDHFDQYNLVVSGHLHVKQEKGNMCFVGSPYQTRMDEIDKKSYFAIVNEDKYKLVEYNEAPEYMVVNSDDIEKYGFDHFDFRNKLITVRLTKKVENFVKLRDIMYKNGAIEVVPEFVKEDIKDVNDAHTVDISEGVVKSAVRYISDIKADKIDNNKLLKCFKEVLKRVK